MGFPKRAASRSEGSGRPRSGPEGECREMASLLVIRAF